MVVLLNYGQNDIADPSYAWWPPADSNNSNPSAIPSGSIYDGDNLFYENPANCGSYTANLGTGNISDYFYTFSHPNHRFIVTGKVFPQVVQVQRRDSASQSFWETNEAILKMPLLEPTFQWHKFDQRARSEGSDIFALDNSQPAQDSMIDFVVFVHRNKFSVVTTYIPAFNRITPVNSNDEYRVNIGYEQLKPTNNFNNFLNTFTHEFAHNNYFAHHQCGANRVHGYHYNVNHYHGMMDGGGTGFMTPNAWERWYRGWLSDEIHVTRDSVPAQGRLYTLKDYSTQGAAMRIRVPNSNLGSHYLDGHDYLWLENHKMVTPFDQKRKWNPPGSDPLYPGIYAFVADNAIMHHASLPFNANGSWRLPGANAIRPLSGFGQYDYVWNGFSALNYYTQNYPNPSYFKSLTAATPNPIAGTGTRQWVAQDLNADGTMEYRRPYGYASAGPIDQIENAAGPSGAAHIAHFRYAGTFTEALQPYQEFSLSGAAPVLNYPEYYDLAARNTHPSTATEFSEPYYLNGLQVQHLGFDANGNAKIFVKYNDYEIRNSTRWCGEIILPDLDTNTTGEVMKLAPNRTITLDLSGTPNRETIHPLTGTWVNPTRLTLQNEAHLRLGSGSKMIVDEFSTLRLESGSRLELQAGAELIVKDGGRLELEDGAWLDISYAGHVHVQQGAEILIAGQPQIDLEGPGGILEIDGQMEIADNSSFVVEPGPYGTGEVHWGVPAGNPYIICGQNSAFKIEGVNVADPILKIKDNCAFKPSASLGKLSLEKGKIAMGNQAWISTGVADVRMIQLDIHQLNPGQRWKTIYLNGQTNHYLQYLQIDGGVTGITGRQFFGQGANLHLQDVNVANCGTGVHVFSRGAQMEDCDLEYNQIGLLHDLPNRPSRLSNCTMRYNSLHGADVRGASANYRLESCHNDFNATDGLRFSGSANLILNCGSVKNNGAIGVNAGMNSRVFLDDSYKRGGAKMTIVGNQVSVLLNNSNNIYLRNGYNDLMSAPFIGMRRDIWGTLNWVTPGTVAQDAANNHWNNRTVPCLGVAPVNGLDNVLLSANNQNILLLDPVRFCPPNVCSNDIPGDGQTETFRLAPGQPQGVLLQTPHFNKVTIPNAVRDAIDDMEEFTGSDDLLAMTKFEEILTYPISSPTEEEIYYLDLALGHMRSCLLNAVATGKVPGTFSANSPTFQPAVQSLLSAQNAYRASQAHAHTQALCDLDLALSYHKVGRNDLALPKLNAISGVDPLFGLTTEIQALLNYSICHVKAQNMVLQGSIPLEDFEAEIAACNVSLKSGISELANLEARFASANLPGNEPGAPALHLFPIPASNELHVEFDEIQPHASTIRIFNVQGIKLIERDVPAYHAGSTLALDKLPSGYYLLQWQCGDLLVNRRFEVQK